MIGSELVWKRFRERMRRALPGLAALLLVLVLKVVHVPALDRITMQVFDGYQILSPREFNPKMPAMIVDIDDESIKRLGQWPWPRDDIARLTQRLTDAQAKSITFDIVFSEPDRTAPDKIAERAAREGVSPEVLAALRKVPDPDAVLANTFQNSPVVLGYFLGNDKGTPPVQPKAGEGIVGSSPLKAVENYSSSIEPLPQLKDAAPGLGFISLKPDEDGIIRRAPMVAAQGEQLLPSLSMEAIRVAQGAGSWKIRSSNGSGELGAPEHGETTVAAVEAGDYVVPTTDDGKLWMYYTAPHPERVVPAWKILTGALSDAEMTKVFGGSLVFVGASAQGLYDLRATPLEPQALGVSIHAQAIEQMVYHQFLVRPYWADSLLERVLLVGLGLVLALSLPWIGAMRGAVLGLVMIGGTVLGCWLAFKQQHFLLDPTYPVLALLLVWIVETAYTYYREERQRAYIHRAFDRYLSPDLVKRIVDDPSRLELGGEEREMTVLFCDIRQFSRTSEKFSPQEIIRFLIAFLTPMCDILLKRKATIDKFIGDAILAFWNAPLDDPDQYGNAARGALEMIERLKELNRTMPGGTEPWPGEVAIGIGMNSGPCCVGNMGSAQRLSYSLIGDTVNLASRIEGLTKYYGAPIAIGEDLAVHLREFATVQLDHVRVVGRDAPETLYALIGDEAVAGTEAFKAFAPSHEEMVRAYRVQAWDEALALLDKGQAAAEGYGLARLYALMRERVADYRANPPGEDWDGVYRAVEK